MTGKGINSNLVPEAENSIVEYKNKLKDALEALKSDIDLAFQGGKGNYFSFDVDEETSTLLQFDIIDLDKPVQDELLESINREGIILYEKV